MCGDYYIGGRRFSSLSDLIGYYSHVSCLLKGEKLLYPVAPPEASKMNKIFFKTLFFSTIVGLAIAQFLMFIIIQEVFVVLNFNLGYNVRTKWTISLKKKENIF